MAEEFDFGDLQDFWQSGPPDEEVKKKKKYSYTPSGLGNIEGLAGYIGRRVGGEPGVFTRCMSHPKTEGSSPNRKYTHEQRAALCARIHKEWTGVWPGEKKRQPTYPGGENLGKKPKASKAYDQVEYGEADGYVYPKIEDWNELTAWINWSEGTEAQEMKGQMEFLERELYDAHRFGHDLSSQYFFAIQGELVTLTNRYAKAGAEAVATLVIEEVKPGKSVQKVALAAFHETKHGGTSHDQRTHGRWNRGRVVTFGDKPEPTLELFKQVASPGGGFTYEPLTNGSPTSGFVVSAHKDREKIIKASNFREKHIVEYLNKNADLLIKPNKFFGAWHNEKTGLVHLDVTEIHDTLETAMAQAKKIDEIAIFDLSTFEEIMAKAKEDKKKNEKLRGTYVKITEDTNKEELAKEIMKKLFPTKGQ